MENCSKSWKHIFVYESGLIDPQPKYPSYAPGQLMYDNHIIALNHVLSKQISLSESTPLDIHRILTKNIEFYEDKDNSGKYRTVDVWIGHETCPSPFVLPNLMKQWYEISSDLIEKNYLGLISGINAASICHHMFECIHPFIDGNGRTGRLLFNMILRICGEEPRIIYFDDRHIYYNEIQKFRDHYFTDNKLLIDDIYEDYNVPPKE